MTRDAMGDRVHSGEFFYVSRYTDAGVEVYDVIWTGGGSKDWFFPLHLCTSNEKGHAEMICDSLTAQLGAGAAQR